MLSETIHVLFEVLERQHDLVDLLLDCNPVLEAAQANEIREIQKFDKKTIAIAKQNTKIYLHGEGKLSLMPVPEEEA